MKYKTYSWKNQRNIQTKFCMEVLCFMWIDTKRLKKQLLHVAKKGCQQNNSGLFSCEVSATNI